MLGSVVKVIVDRPMGSCHPEYPELYYPINYGYIDGVIAEDGEEQDAYILGVDKSATEFVGRVIAVIHRKNDVEDKLVVVPDGTFFSKEQIAAFTYFQEQYFDTDIKM